MQLTGWGYGGTHKIIRWFKLPLPETDAQALATKRNNMEKKKIRDCLGDQGRDFLYGNFPEKCLDCDQFDICHKLTISGCLQSIADGVTLIIQNGLATNKLMGFSELDKLFEWDTGIDLDPEFIYAECRKVAQPIA